jgi:hypothetical protein
VRIYEENVHDCALISELIIVLHTSSRVFIDFQFQVIDVDTNNLSVLLLTPHNAFLDPLQDKILAYAESGFHFF